MDQGLKPGASLMGSLFQADELALYDYEENCRRKDHLCPEERLLFAILQDAISCFQMHLHAEKADERALFIEAERWIFDDSTEFVSFCSICDVLKIDPTYVRRGLLDWKRRQLGRMSKGALKSRWRSLAHGQRSLTIAIAK